MKFLLTLLFISVEIMTEFVMPAQAGIQSVVDINNFKDLNSRSRFKACRDKLRGNDGVLPITAQSESGGDGWGQGHLTLFFYSGEVNFCK